MDWPDAYAFQAVLAATVQARAIQFRTHGPHRERWTASPESAKLIAGGEKTVVLCIDHEEKTFIRPSTETRHTLYEIDAARLAELIQRHGKKVDKPS
jgi:hypothetical protein